MLKYLEDGYLVCNSSCSILEVAYYDLTFFASLELMSKSSLYAHACLQVSNIMHLAVKHGSKT